MLSITWFPPDAAPIIFDADSSDFSLVTVEGLSSTLAQPKTRQGPGQIGASLTGVTVDPRTIKLTVELATISAVEMWQKRQQLSAALVSLPYGSGQSSPKGILRLSRVGQPDIDIEAIPQAAPDIVLANEFYAVATIEFFCPDPFYKDPVDSSALMQANGGFQFGSSSIQFPLEILSYNLKQDITNSGTAPSPVIMRIFGACTTPRMKNMTTGEVIELTTTIADGSFIEINTAYGNKSITLTNSLGVTTNAMGLLNLAKSDFWQLRPGLNIIVFEAEFNPSGSAVLFWRQRYSGV